MIYAGIAVGVVFLIMIGIWCRKFILNVIAQLRVSLIHHVLEESTIRQERLELSEHSFLTIAALKKTSQLRHNVCRLTVSEANHIFTYLLCTSSVVAVEKCEQKLLTLFKKKKVTSHEDVQKMLKSISLLDAGKFIASYKRKLVHGKTEYVCTYLFSGDII